MNTKMVNISESFFTLNELKQIGKDIDNDKDRTILNTGLQLFPEKNQPTKNKSFLEMKVGKMIRKTKHKTAEYEGENVVGCVTVSIDGIDDENCKKLMKHVFEWAKNTLGTMEEDANVICIRKSEFEEQLILELYYVPIAESDEHTYVISETKYWENNAIVHSESWLYFSFFTDVILYHRHFDLDINYRFEKIDLIEIQHLKDTIENLFNDLDYKLMIQDSKIDDCNKKIKALILDNNNSNKKLNEANEEKNLYEKDNERLYTLVNLLRHNKDAIYKTCDTIIKIMDMLNR